MQYSIIALSALLGASSALYTADTSKPPSGNAIHDPISNSKVVAGKPFTINWSPSSSEPVSIVLLRGPRTNVQYLSTIADSTANNGNFVWNVPADLTPQASEYAIEIIQQDGEYQYSPQIGIAGPDGSYTASSPATTAAASQSYGSVETAPVSSGQEGTAVCGALDECASTSAAAATSTHSKDHTKHHATGTGNVTSPVVAPTGAMSVPTSLATVAQPGSQVTQTSIAVVGATGAGSPPKSTSLSAAFAAPGAQLSGAAALVAGLLGLLAL